MMAPTGSPQLEVQILLKPFLVNTVATLVSSSVNPVYSSQWPSLFQQEIPLSSVKNKSFLMHFHAHRSMLHNDHEHLNDVTLFIYI